MNMKNQYARMSLLSPIGLLLVVVSVVIITPFKGAGV
jgi:hypothetical protein